MTGLPPPYPLCWPPGRARQPAARREPDRYEAKTVAQALKSLEAEIARWRAAERAARILAWELTSDPAPRGRDDPDDPAAALWFALGGRDITAGAGLMVLACDRFRRLAQNIRAIGLTMERLRLVDEIGAYSLVAAVEGARALPPPSGARFAGSEEGPWPAVLGVASNAPLAVAEAAYRALAKRAHADAGGDDRRMRRLNLAIEAARKALA